MLKALGASRFEANFQVTWHNYDRMKYATTDS